MIEPTLPTLPNLSFSHSVDAFPLNQQQNPLIYKWKFITCAEFCEEFGIRKKSLLQSVFEKIKHLGTAPETDTNTNTELVAETQYAQLFQCLYHPATTPEFIKKIIAFPEFRQYLKTNNADHCLILLSTSIEACIHYKKQLSHIVTLFHTHPAEACLALVRFTHSVETLPEGEEKNQLRWLLDQTRHAWYKENYLVSHALTSPFLEDYLHTHPQWAPCVDFVLTLMKQDHTLSAQNWNDILSLTSYQPALFCEAIGQSTALNQLDINLFTPLLSEHHDNLRDFLTLTQHHPARFTLWTKWVHMLPEKAHTIFALWQNQLPHLTTEAADQEIILEKLIQANQLGTLKLSSDATLALTTLDQTHRAIIQITITNREKDKLPENKRHLVTEIALLTSVKAVCWTLGASMYSTSLAHELYNIKIVPRLGITLSYPNSGFDNALYGMYASVGHPLSGNRIFEYTAQESFKKTFLNGFKLFTRAEIGKQYFDHLNSPKMSDAEFYHQVLSKP